MKWPEDDCSSPPPPLIINHLVILDSPKMNFWNKFISLPIAAPAALAQSQIRRAATSSGPQGAELPGRKVPGKTPISSNVTLWSFWAGLSGVLVDPLRPEVSIRHCVTFLMVSRGRCGGLCQWLGVCWLCRCQPVTVCPAQWSPLTSSDLKWPSLTPTDLSDRQCSQAQKGDYMISNVTELNLIFFFSQSFLKIHFDFNK